MAQNGKRERKIMIATERSERRGVGWLGEVPMADQNPKKKTSALCF
jgi:hypothetical protein